METAGPKTSDVLKDWNTRRQNYQKNSIKHSGKELRCRGHYAELFHIRTRANRGSNCVIGKTVEKMEGLLGDSGASLYAGDPYDSYA